MLEKTFMAAETNDDLGRQDGPFESAAEAELQAAKLGWGWVVVYTHAVDDDGTVVDAQKRFYQPAKPATKPEGQQLKFRSLEEIAQLRRTLSTPDPKPLNHEEILFFASYEIQMLPEPAPRIDPAKFKADIKRRING